MLLRFASKAASDHPSGEVVIVNGISVTIGELRLIARHDAVFDRLLFVRGLGEMPRELRRDYSPIRVVQLFQGLPDRQVEKLFLHSTELVINVLLEKGVNEMIDVQFPSVEPHLAFRFDQVALSFKFFAQSSSKAQLLDLADTRHDLGRKMLALHTAASQNVSQILAQPGDPLSNHGLDVVRQACKNYRL